MTGEKDTVDASALRHALHNKGHKALIHALIYSGVASTFLACRDTARDETHPAFGCVFVAVLLSLHVTAAALTAKNSVTT